MRTKSAMVCCGVVLLLCAALAAAQDCLEPVGSVAVRLVVRRCGGWIHGGDGERGGDPDPRRRRSPRRRLSSARFASPTRRRGGDLRRPRLRRTTGDVRHRLSVPTSRSPGQAAVYNTVEVRGDRRSCSTRHSSSSMSARRRPRPCRARWTVCTRDFGLVKGSRRRRHRRRLESWSVSIDHPLSVPSAWPDAGRPASTNVLVDLDPGGLVLGGSRPPSRRSSKRRGAVRYRRSETSPEGLGGVIVRGHDRAPVFRVARIPGSSGLLGDRPRRTPRDTPRVVSSCVPKRIARDAPRRSSERSCRRVRRTMNSRPGSSIAARPRSGSSNIGAARGLATDGFPRCRRSARPSDRTSFPNGGLSLSRTCFSHADLPQLRHHRSATTLDAWDHAGAQPRHRSGSASAFSRSFGRGEHHRSRHVDIDLDLWLARRAPPSGTIPSIATWSGSSTELPGRASRVRPVRPVARGGFGSPEVAGSVAYALLQPSSKIETRSRPTPRPGRPGERCDGVPTRLEARSDECFFWATHAGARRRSHGRARPHVGDGFEFEENRRRVGAARARARCGRCRAISPESDRRLHAVTGPAARCTGYEATTLKTRCRTQDFRLWWSF